MTGESEVTESPDAVLALRLAQIVKNDPHLAELIDAWPTLADAVKASILAMIEAAKGDKGTSLP